MPERYAISSLCKSLENVYKGKIVILGRPNVKPHDVVYVEDIYNQISGAVKVGKVTQIFSYKTGWLTEIHPKMLVTPAGAVTLDQVNAMKRASKKIAARNISIFNSGFTLDEVSDADKGVLTQFSNALGTQGRAAVNTAFDIGLTGATLVAAKRNLTNLPSATRQAFDAAKAAKTGSTLAKFGSGAGAASTTVLRAAGRVARVPILGLLVDYAITRYISWSKTRQPISFLPVHREGKPWYTALHGIKNNSEYESIRDGVMEDIGYLYDFYKDKITGDENG